MEENQKPTTYKKVLKIPDEFALHCKFCVVKDSCPLDFIFFYESVGVYRIYSILTEIVYACVKHKLQYQSDYSIRLCNLCTA